ncbi:choice-of-anchor L domain-containing protein [Shimia thalassica]|uniref:choice-of-anchor L domain-containing protein n=1 Tax=Shimia thalassica TaxID=1715693 RepID=UPI0027326700|nr:choice-of-anchor L domain-containing protein [Shimia thalassica]MDP2518448.1 choice-of-anchor L domain-containing protein [Shimia thalassica]
MIFRENALGGSAWYFKMISITIGKGMVQATELQIDTSVTAEQMAAAMFGAGVTVVSSNYSGDALSSGIFTGGQTTSPDAVPADTGVILSTGQATSITNSSGDANQATNTSTNTAGIDGDTLLNGIAGVATYDAAIFEAEFIPTGDTLTMQLVFSSEEYLEWVNAGYNDAVGIWVNGTKAELAIGDGDISIDNINTTTNENLYIDNTNSIVNSEMDGLTITLTVKAPVEVGEVNTLRLGIADAGDAVYDSNLLIVGDSIQTALIANDDAFTMTSKGVSKIDLMENDTGPTGATLFITHINGQAIEVGETVVLDTGQSVTLEADGSLITATRDAGSTVFTYTVSDGNGSSDVAYATILTDPVDGTSGNDWMRYGYSDNEGNTIDGDDGDSEVIMGYGGNDKIFAGLGHDDIYGGEGNDFIRAASGDDLIDGGSGRDVLDGGTGVDTMIGGEGNDIYYIDNVDDVVTENADEGRDLVITDISHALAADFEDLRFSAAETALVGTGNDNNNMITGNAQDNTLSGLGGNDRILAGDGNDTVYGGAGRDALDGNGGNDSLVGGAGHDKLFSHEGDDTLEGGTGSDNLRGGEGSDVLDGGEGRDLVSGGTGADTFIFRSNDGYDTVFDFELGVDTLELYGINSTDLQFSSFGSGTLVEMGGDDQIVFKEIAVSDFQQGADIQYFDLPLV